MWNSPLLGEKEKFQLYQKQKASGEIYNYDNIMINLEFF